jgi:hypothetical protein
MKKLTESEIKEVSARLNRTADSEPITKEKTRVLELTNRVVAQLSGTTKSSSLPANLQTPEFTAVWEDWLKHLTEKRKKPTSLSKERQLKKLSAMGPSRAIDAIEHSIEKNWQGIFAPADSEAKQTPVMASQTPRNAVPASPLPPSPPQPRQPVFAAPAWEDHEDEP